VKQEAELAGDAEFPLADVGQQGSPQRCHKVQDLSIECNREV
jgi:hypothetical protein